MEVRSPAALKSLERVAARERELTRWLHAQFRRRLSRDDAREAVADAIALAHRDLDALAPLEAEQVEGWVRTRAYRNAIDQIRAIDGYGQAPRKASVSLDDNAETVDLEAPEWESIDDEIIAGLDGADDVRAVELALRRLTSDEGRLLRLRYGDNLPVKAIADLLDIHPKKYERLHTRALKKLRTVFIETAACEHCEPVRELIGRSREQRLTHDLSAQIAAHVESCPHCRAYEKRSLKLIAALPLPAVAGADRMWARVQAIVPGLSARGDDLAAGTAGTAAVAGAGGTAASSGVIAGLGTKAVVALCGGVAATVCVGVVTLPRVLTAKPSSPRAAIEKRQLGTTPAAKPATPASRATTRGTSGAAAKARHRTRPASAGHTSKKPRAGAATGAQGTSTTGTLAPDTFDPPALAAAPPPPPPPPPPASSKFTGEFAP